MGCDIKHYVKQKLGVLLVHVTIIYQENFKNSEKLVKNKIKKKTFKPTIHIQGQL